MVETFHDMNHNSVKPINCLKNHLDHEK